LDLTPGRWQQIATTYELAVEHAELNEINASPSFLTSVSCQAQRISRTVDLKTALENLPPRKERDRDE
jgi:hypothetical protein